MKTENPTKSATLPTKEEEQMPKSPAVLSADASLLSQEAAALTE